MNLSLKIAVVVAGLIIILSVMKLVKKHSFHPSFAVLWLFVGIFLISISIFEKAYAFVARSVFGLYGGDHLIYITLLSFLLVYSFYLTSRICQMADRVSKLISFTAVLESEVADLKKQREKKSES